MTNKIDFWQKSHKNERQSRKSKDAKREQISLKIRRLELTSINKSFLLKTATSLCKVESVMHKPGHLNST